MTPQFLDDKTNLDIVSLLTVSKLSNKEKSLWVAVLPEMTTDEKEELRQNLTAEVAYETKVSKQAAEEEAAKEALVKLAKMTS